MPGPNTRNGMLLENSVYKEWASIIEELNTVPAGLQDEGLVQLKEETAKLLKEMQPHYTERNDMGSYVPMTVGEYEKLREQYKKCLKAFQSVSKETEEHPTGRKLRTMLLNDMNALNGLSEDSLPPLADVLIGSKVPVAELYETAKDNTIGDALSSREAIEYTDKDGTVHRGFFTEDKAISNLAAELQSIYDRYTKKYPQYEAFFLELEEKQDEFMQNVRALHRQNNEAGYNSYVNQVAYQSEIKITDRGEFREMCLDLAKECEPIRNLYSILSSSKIKSGSKIAKRAGAMTDIAAALGQKDLLASSRRITVKRGDQEVSGVMMDAAFLDGVDRKKLTEDHPFLKVEKAEFDNPDLLRSLADLQILDYLCANTDRHKNNFFMRLDNIDPDHPKITGVQGIDNDNAFGALPEGGVMRLARSSNLKVISSQMAEKICAMTTKDLDRIMEPYEFTIFERQMAEARLFKLQAMIENGKHPDQDKPAFDEKGLLITGETEIRVIKDGEWNQLTLNSLVPKDKKEENLFLHAQGIRDDQVHKKGIIENKRKREAWLKETYPDRWEKEQKEKEKNEKAKAAEKEKKTAPFSYTRSDDTTLIQSIQKELEEEHQQLKNIDLDLLGAHGNEKKRSRKFKDMYQKMYDLSDEYHGLAQSLREFKTLDENERKELDASFKRLAEKRENLLQAASVYLKKGSFLSSPDLTTRKNCAASLKQFSEKQPKSELLYQRGMALKDKQKEDLSKKNGYEFSTYQTRQLQDMMKKALYDNVASLPTSDPKRALGVKALAAQERLWKFSQKNTLKDAAVPAQKQKMDFNRMNAESRQVEKDVKAILAYAPDVKTMIDQMNEKNKNSKGPDRSIKVESLTPRQARTVLGMLFEHESTHKQNQAKKTENRPVKEEKISLNEEKNQMKLFRADTVHSKSNISKVK